MLKINLGAESAAMLEKTRRAVNSLQSSVKRVASGVAIESAGDDPGAIGSVVFTETAISGIQRTLKNLNEGITITQALSSDLGLVEDLLLTLREVTEQAASDQFTDSQRADLQADAQSILRKIDIAVKQAGSEYGYDLTQNDSVSISGSPDLSINTQIVLTDLLVEDLGKRAVYSSQRNGVFTSPLQDDSLIVNGVAIRATTSDDDTVSTTYQSGSAIAKALAINVASDLTGVVAEAGQTSITGNRAVSSVELTGLNYFILNGSVINGVSVSDFDSNFASLQKAINEETKFTGVTASIDSNGQLTLTAEDGRNISIRYSNQEVLNAVGVTDKEGDVANLFGAVELGSPDRVLQGEVQLPINTDFQNYTGNVSVGGRFDAPEDYVDFVAHVVKSGGFGVAEIRLDRDPASEVTPIEDYAFIEGTVDPNVDISAVLGNFFSLNGGEGTVTAGGNYNEGLDRDYIITTTTAGTTDGAERAVFEVSTAQDGVVGTFTASANTNILIAGARTGEDVFIRLSSSPRQSTLTSSLASGHAHNTAVTLGGTYTGLVDSNTTIEVLSSGRTQRTPQATVQVYHDGVAFGGVETVNGDASIDIGNGQNLTIATDVAEYSAVNVSKTGTYSEPVTVNSDPLDFTGIGSGTYRIRLTQAGFIGDAEYVVDKIDQSNNVSQVEGVRTLSAGTVLLTDGITFNFPTLPPAISSTTASTSHSQDEVDNYQDYSGITISGDYDGARGDTTLAVRVKREGIVLGAAESEAGRDDYAILEYSFGGAAFTGDLVAREGDIAIDNGVNFTLPAASSITTLVDQANINNDFGSSVSLSGASIGYNGSIDLNLDTSAHQFNEDVNILFDAPSSVEIMPSGSAPSGETLTIKVVGESGTTYHSTDIQPLSGTAYTIGDGLELTFNNNVGTSIALTLDPATAPADGNATLVVEPSAVYNSVAGDASILFSYRNKSTFSVTEDSNNDDVTNDGSDIYGRPIGTYDGSYDNFTMTMDFGGGPSVSITPRGTADDAASPSLTGSYNSTNAGDDIQLDFLNSIAPVITRNQGSNGVDDGNFNIALTNVDNVIQAQHQNIDLDVETTRAVGFRIVEIGVTSDLYTIIGTPNGQYLDRVRVRRQNDNTLRFRGDLGRLDLNISEFNTADHTFDLGDPMFNGYLSADPGYDIQVNFDGMPNGKSLDIYTELINTYTFTNRANGESVQAEPSNNAGTFRLDLDPFITSPIFGQQDPGFNLQVTNEDDFVDDVFNVQMQTTPTVKLRNRTSGTSEELVLNINGDGSQGTFDLAQTNAFDADPGIDLLVNNPFQMNDDSFKINTLSKSVNFSADFGGGDIREANGIEHRRDYLLTSSEFSSIFTNGAPGAPKIRIEPTNAHLDIVDDIYNVSFVRDRELRVSHLDGTRSGKVNVNGDGTVDLGQSVVTRLLNPTGTSSNDYDPGFDLISSNIIDGNDDEYTLELRSNPSINALNDENITKTNVHSLQVADEFSASLTPGRFEVGDTYSVDVDSAHLQDGTVYAIENLLGRFNAGDQLIVDADHEFKDPTYVLGNSVSLLNGLTLDFDQDGAFEIGDEVRFQVRGYTGNPIASGTYSYAISPTTFTVEVTDTGDVDGGAKFKYTRADTGEVFTNLNASSTPTLLADGVKISFSAGRVYAGDQFFINTFESLDQTFGGQLTLSSANSIDLEMANADGDNLLGRLSYNGGSPKAPGTSGNLTEAILGLNQDTAVGQIDLRTQETAEKAVVYTDNAQESLSLYQSRVNLAQSRLEDISSSLQNSLLNQTDFLQQKIKVDVAQESDRSTQAITQIAGASIVAAIGQQTARNPVNLLEQSLVSIETDKAPNSDQVSPLDRFSGKTQAEKAEDNKKRFKDRERQKEKSIERLEQMKRSVENARQRSSAVMSNMEALRQLASAHLELNNESRVEQIESQGTLTPKPNNTFDKLMEKVGQSTQAVDPNPAQREAQESIRQAESNLREMKALALAAQSANQFERDGLQAQLQNLVFKLQEQDLTTAVKASQLGQYSSSQSAGTLDSNQVLQDGELSIMTALGQKVSIRGTIPSDDPFSVRNVLGSALAKANAINSQSAQHGVSAIAGPTVAFSDLKVGSASLKDGNFLRINGEEISGVEVLSGDTDSALRDAINLLSQNTGVKASSMQDGKLRLMAMDGRNITVDAYGEATKLGLTPVGSARAESRTTGGALTLSSRRFFTLESSRATSSVTETLGNLSSIPSTKSIKGLDLSSTRNIIDSLSVIDLALNDLQNFQSSTET